MKMYFLTAAVLTGLVLSSSCKKNNNDKLPVPKNELLGPETSKIFHYTFNGGLKDASGNNLNATDSLNISYGADRLGRPNQALILGGAGNTTTVSTPSISAQQLLFPFAVSFWFKQNSLTGTQYLIRSDGANPSNSTYTGFWIATGANGAGSFSFNYGDNSVAGISGRNSLIVQNAFTANTWYHMAVNCRGRDDMDLYINGTKSSTVTYEGTASTMLFSQPASTGIMGMYGSGFTGVFGGMLDDYRIYKKVLTQTEVSNLYNFTP